MKLVYAQTNGQKVVAVWEDDQHVPITNCDSLAALLEHDDIASFVSKNRDDTAKVPMNQATLLAPIDQQEVWAAGVTYKRSKTARMEESEAAASCYDRVYQSARPELFFKATNHRVRGHGQALRIRGDSQWNLSNC